MNPENKTQFVRLNLGCGHHPPEGWLNVDNSLGARLAKFPYFNRLNASLHIFKLQWDHRIFIHDLRKPFPWKDQSIDIIYSSHTLEHFPRQEGRHFLGECARVLKPDGIIRLLVPDLQAIISQYLNGKIPADEFIDRLMVTYDTGEDGFWRKKLAPFVRSPHKCLYDASTLLNIMETFRLRMHEKKPFESEIEEIEDIETSERTHGVVILEGRKMQD